jgi:hypothetical protein
LVVPPTHHRDREAASAVRSPQRRPATLLARPRRGDVSHR